MFSSKNIVVMDLETKKSFKEVGGKSNLDKLKISVAGVYDYLTEEYIAYEEKDLMKLEKRLDDVDLIVGFNIIGFDMPVIAPYLFKPIDQFPVLDLLTDIQEDRGHRASLDSIAGPTLKQHKTGTGADALILWDQGRLEELKKYCLKDVEITKNVFEHGCKEGKVLFTSNWDYKTYEIPVKWKKDAESLIKNASSQESFPSSLF